MARDPIPRENQRLFRITQAFIALFFGGLAAWMFNRGYDTIMASLFAGASLFALIDAVLGWRKNRD